MLAAQIETSITDTVGIAANRSAQEQIIVLQIINGGIVTQHDICQIAVLVRNPQRNQIAAKIRDRGRNKTGTDGIKISGFSGRKLTENFFHRKSPLRVWNGIILPQRR